MAAEAMLGGMEDRDGVVVNGKVYSGHPESEGSLRWYGNAWELLGCLPSAGPAWCACWTPPGSVQAQAAFCAFFFMSSVSSPGTG